MCIILKEDFDKIGEAMKDFLQAYNTVCSYEQMADDLKDNLSDLKDAKKLTYCGCDGPLTISQIWGGHIVTISILNNAYKYTIIQDEITRELIPFRDLFDDYDGWQPSLNDWA